MHHAVRGCAHVPRRATVCRGLLHCVRLRTVRGLRYRTGTPNGRWITNSSLSWGTNSSRGWNSLLLSLSFGLCSSQSTRDGDSVSGHSMCTGTVYGRLASLRVGWMCVDADSASKILHKLCCIVLHPSASCAPLNCMPARGLVLWWVLVVLVLVLPELFCIHCAATVLIAWLTANRMMIRLICRILFGWSR